MILDIILYLLFGAVAGWLAGQIMRGGGFGLIWNIIIGIVGSVVGGFVAGLFGIKSDNFIGSFVISVVGAIICLLLYNYLV